MIDIRPKLQDIEFREVGLEHLDEIGGLRARVWGPLVTEMHLDEGRLIDAAEEHSVHWAAFHEGRIVAAARLTVGYAGDLANGQIIEALDPEAVWPSSDITRLVVAPEYRSIGIARELDRIRLMAAKDAGAHAVYGTTSHRVVQLERLDFQRVGRVSELFCRRVLGVAPAGEEIFLMKRDWSNERSAYDVQILADRA